MPGFVRSLLTVFFVSTVLVHTASAQDPPVFQFSFGGFGTGDGQLIRPRSISIRGNEVYVLEFQNQRISVFDLHGNFLRNFESRSCDAHPFLAPKQVAVAPDGSVYVSDDIDHCVLKFDPNGNFLLQWGSLGTGDTQFNRPDGIAFDDDGDVWVVDRTNGELKEFDSSGNFLSKIDGGSQMSGATDVIPNSDGTFWVTMWQSSIHDLRLFDAAGLVLDSTVNFGAPRGLAQAPDGILYVVSSSTHRAYAVDPVSLDVITDWGGFGSEDRNFNRPHDVAVADNGWIYVADSSNSLVKVFDYSIFADGLNLGHASNWSDIEPPIDLAVTVFVTRAPFQGGLGGLAGGDEACNNAATAAGLSGNWIAWLSDETIDARNRIPDGEYRLVDGTTIVANDLADLTDGMLTAPIDQDEHGNPWSPNVWTGTQPDGTLYLNIVGFGDTCLDWTISTNSRNAVVGNSSSTDGNWTAFGNQEPLIPQLSGCVSFLSLYCFGITD